MNSQPEFLARTARTERISEVFTRMMKRKSTRMTSDSK